MNLSIEVDARKFYIGSEEEEEDPDTVMLVGDECSPIVEDGEVSFSLLSRSTSRRGTSSVDPEVLDFLSHHGWVR